jgi:hypothetical protein
LGERDAGVSLGNEPPTLMTPPNSFSILTE